ncbi:MAG TPA: polymer-forming cytoskeletal protein [Clostridiales bacterium]|nr:polymer-forming cytoskeletal protein [Clostridiales bacterium]
MSDERIRILKLFKEGKISMEETLQLLEALEESGFQDEPGITEAEIIDSQAAVHAEKAFAKADNSHMPGDSDKDIPNADNEPAGDSSGSNTGDRDSKKYMHGFNIKIPKIKIPKISIPNIPDIEIPEINIPPIKVPGVNITSSDDHDNISISSIGNIDGDINVDSISVSGKGSFTGNVNCDRINISGDCSFQKNVSADKVVVSGKLHIGGETSADEIAVSGIGSFGSSVSTDKFDTSGYASIKGSLSGDSIYNSGTLKVEGDISADSLNTSGSLQTERGIKADSIKVSGTLKTGSDVFVDSFNSSGCFSINGALIADSIKVELNSSDCRVAKDIKADIVNVFKRNPQNEVFLDAPAMITDSADLVNTRLKILKGSTLKIGTGCIIDRVEYTDELTVLEGAVVKEKVKVYRLDS